MKQFPFVPLLILLSLPLAIGCGSAGESTATAPIATPVSIDGSKFLLAEEPEDAVGVIEARESSEDGKSLALVGRIGGSTNPWIEGRAAFMLLDASMSVVAEGEDCEDGEICTGDCCATERLECTALVKLVDAEGKLVSVDSRELLGLKESDLIVVKGQAKKDESGNFVMLAKSIYIRR
ncbi:hypothetical protein [Bythopirellula polymerisocia]|uniref:DUF5666 domain-containing protein n=1 Tax=Bythopirellula polymerisocia TaxID=2528003 RepID=A0A5C6CFE1_9BACT|nr:hypothetical protein [Bythopirellula polymerisocia]TWU22735.1 hypothetical protein Pla144_41960 [Bythopirellula polymerisocia]